MYVTVNEELLDADFVKLMVAEMESSTAGVKVIPPEYEAVNVWDSPDEIVAGPTTIGVTRF